MTPHGDELWVIKGGKGEQKEKKPGVTLASHWYVTLSHKLHYAPEKEKPSPTLISDPASIIPTYK